MKLILRWLFYSLYLILGLFFLQSNILAQAKLKQNFKQKNRKNLEFIPDKRPLSDTDKAKKKEGLYFTGLPLINVDPVGGVGYGLRVILFENGSRNNALFDYAPYFHKVFAQAFFTTKGRHFHTINWDAPYLFRFLNKWFRVRSQINYDDDPTINYYGIGDESARPVHFRISGASNILKSIRDVDEFQEYLDQFENKTGNTASRYNKVRLFRPTWTISTESDIFYVLNGAVRLTFGFNFQYVDVTDYTGNTVELYDDKEKRDKKFQQVDTKLKQDFKAGLIYGINDSWNNGMRFAISFDNRDYEPDPNRGTFTEFTMEFIPQFLGSRFGYSRYNLTSRVYYDPIPNYEDFVIAVRGSYYFVIGDRAPFYALGDVLFSNTLSPEISGGGFRTLRGYRSRRFAGKANALFNFELRWTFWHFPPAAGQQFSLILVPFVDIGRAFESVALTNGKDWGLSYGAGLRIAWNQATIIFVDYGRSAEGGNVYINFNHVF